MQNSARGSLFSNRPTAPHSHRRHRRNRRRLFSYLLEYIGDQLYYLGAAIEREVKNTRRAVRRGVRRFFGAAGRGFSRVFRLIGRWLAVVMNDLFNPFKKIGRSLRSLVIILRDTKSDGFSARMRRLGQFFRYGWIWNKHLIFRLLNYLFPAAALAAALFVVYGMIHLNFALSVHYNGEAVGYVANEQAYEAAQRIVQSRIIETDETEGSGWRANAELGLAVVPAGEVSSQSKMADSLLTLSGNEIETASGLYIDGTFYGATTESDTLGETLDALLAPYRARAAGDENTEIRFARNVEIVDGVYPEKSVRDFDEIENVITSVEQQPVYDTMGEEETISDIAARNNVTIQYLEELNPDVNLEEVETGQTFLVAPAEPLLAVKVVTVLTEQEDVYFETVTQPDDRFTRNYSQVLREGQDGRREVKYEIQYENGVEISRTVVEETVLTEMIPRIVLVGSRSGVITTPPATSGGQLAWPTGTFQFISRGWSSYHQAIDIAGATGTAIYAADPGTVVLSQWSDVGYGYHIIIDHENGMQTLYAHCSELLMNEGDRVSRGQLIAAMGSTGNSTGPHLHFEVRIGGQKQIPEGYLGLGGPLGG